MFQLHEWLDIFTVVVFIHMYTYIYVCASCLADKFALLSYDIAFTRATLWKLRSCSEAHFACMYTVGTYFPHGYPTHQKPSSCTFFVLPWVKFDDLWTNSTQHKHLDASGSLVTAAKSPAGGMMGTTLSAAANAWGCAHQCPQPGYRGAVL